MPSRELDFQKRTIHNSRNSSDLTSPADSISKTPSGDLPTPDRASRGTFARGIPVADLLRFAEEWHLDCAYRLHSEKITETRRYFVKSLSWFLKKRGYTHCGTSEMRQLFHYLLHGHEGPGRRFGQKQLNRPLRPITVSVKSINGMGTAAGGGTLIVNEASPNPLLVQDGNIAIHVVAQRNIIQRCAGGRLSNPNGLPLRFFLENVNDSASGDDFCRPGQKVYARQVNMEYRGWSKSSATAARCGFSATRPKTTAPTRPSWRRTTAFWKSSAATPTSRAAWKTAS
jgi:hypothetical protein